MDDNYYIHIEGKNYGPLSTDEIKNWASEGRFGDGHFIWSAALDEWVKAGEVSFLNDLLPSVKPNDESYYVRIGEDTIGPMNLDDVVALIEGRQFNAMDFIWLEDDKRWVRAGEVTFLSQYFLKQIRGQVSDSKVEQDIEEMRKIDRTIVSEHSAVTTSWRLTQDSMRGHEDDRKYLKTLVFMFLMHVLIIVSVNFVEVPAPDERPGELLKRVTTLVTDKPLEIPEIEELTVETEVIGVGDGKEAGGGGGEGAGKGGGLGDDFASKGVIGLITKMGSGGNVADMLGTGSDLDLAITSIGGLSTEGGEIGYGSGGAPGFGDGMGLGSGGGSGLGGLASSGPTGVGKKISKGRMHVQPPGISGSAASNSLRSSAAIARIVNQRKSGIEYLYKKHLKTSPTMEGKLVVRFTIAADGSVTSASVVSSGLGNATLESQICSRIRTWRFPPIDAGAGDVTVVYPFVFFSAG
ncbi:MAG: DUF4339 domain-containing protein [bacterium]|nr:DUF4339 domain-containing protein [bacterium]